MNELVMSEKVKELYIDKFGVEPLSVVRLNGAGSNRVYYRLCGDAASVIGVVGTSVDENRAFVALSKVPFSLDSFIASNRVTSPRSFCR